MEDQLNEALEIIDRAKFELQCMVGRNCIDYGKLLAILDGKL